MKIDEIDAEHCEVNFRNIFLKIKIFDKAVFPSDPSIDEN